MVQMLVKIHSFVLKILTPFKSRNFVTNWQKWTFNNPKLDVVNINASAKFGQNTFIHTPDIERKRNSVVIKGP